MKKLFCNKSRVSSFDARKASMMAAATNGDLYILNGTTSFGLTSHEAERRLEDHGPNEVPREDEASAIKTLIKAFINPFVGILGGLAIVSAILDVILAEPEERDWTGIIVISTMVLLSVILRFVQEWKANRSSAALLRMVSNTCAVVRQEDDEPVERDITTLVPGDVIRLSAGDMIPADVRLTATKDFFVSQASLTGESDMIEKTETPIEKIGKNDEKSENDVLAASNLCFMGSTVISGSASAVVYATGANTYLGTMASSLTGKRPATAFDKGITKTSLLLIRFMAVMVPLVFLINGITKGDWVDAFIFAVSVAVGLTPEMLPMIVSANLSKGAVTMSKKKTIVKDINAIQNFGAINILCTDKTGTLTCDRIVLEKYLNADGSPDTNSRVLRHAYFNSFFQTGLRNLMDKAILQHVRELGLEKLSDTYTKIDEIPFDFTRRRMSVVVEDKEGKRQIITKGAVEEMLAICTHMEENGQVVECDGAVKDRAVATALEMNRRGLRVLAVAQKNYTSPDNNFSVADESEMVLIGFLAFMDPPKPSAAAAVKKLHESGVEVKVLSGDNEAVVCAAARLIGINTSHSVTGPQFEKMGHRERRRAVSTASVFSKLTPLQKTEIIALLQEGQNTVGFLGDGINDAPALKMADVGISVDTAVDIAKESADIILLEKDLTVLHDGVIEGRRTFGNISKYIKMTASSNFGNMFSVLVASAFLPFLPMLPIHLLIQNLLYDVSQTSIPFDQMDEEYLRSPRSWDASDLTRFMLLIGPISSIFDIATFMLMYYIFGCDTIQSQALFQAGWFVEGLLSQTLIVHMIRTRKIPFIQSRASWPVLALTAAIIMIGIAIPFTSIGHSMGFVELSLSYFPWLVAILGSYCMLTQVIKNWYVKRYNRWL